MELQYAMLCHRVDLPTQDEEALLLSVPVSSLITSNLAAAGFPLFVTFINCTEGRHNIRVECSDFAGEIVSTVNHALDCIRDSVECFDSFLVEFPIHKTDLLTFSLYLDGMKQRQIKLPIKVE